MVASRTHGHTGGAVLPHVPEHHGDHVHRGTEVVGDAGRFSIVVGSLAPPGLEDRLDGQPQLLVGVGRERGRGPPRDRLLEGGDDGPQVLGGQLGVGLHTTAGPPVPQHRFEGLVVDTEHHAPEHLDQATIGVEHEALVARRRHHPGDHPVVQADVEDRVHHAGHRELGPGPAGDEEGVVRVTESLARSLFECGHGPEDLVPEGEGELAVRVGVGPARLGRHSETRWHGDAEAGHVPEVGSLATEQAPHRVPVALQVILDIVDLIEAVHPLESRLRPGRGRLGTHGNTPRSKPDRSARANPMVVPGPGSRQGRKALPTRSAPITRAAGAVWPTGKRWTTLRT